MKQLRKALCKFLEMNRILPILFLTVCFSCFSQTQTQMNEDVSAEFNQADKELNIIYREILAEYKTDSLFIKNLKSSQRLWINLRDAELEMKFPDYQTKSYGTIHSLCRASYLLELTKNRTKILKEWLMGANDLSACSSSVKILGSHKNLNVNKLENSHLINVLNNSELIGENREDNLSVRIYKIDNGSGSAVISEGHDVSHNLLIAVSEFDEQPLQNLFEIGPFYSPQFINWTSQKENEKEFEIEHGIYDNRKIIALKVNINEIQLE